ncbi:MAG: ABC transporter ATP-binding protein [Candidatus Altiarchaeales archaeon]|nr:ABC transporter ATP-binding protein [Candidatus Altiarchaeales archaeon]
MPAIELKNVSKRFENITAVDGVSFRIKDREYVTLLGPSGCGKTTLLRMIAGLLKPSEGDILIDGKSVVGMPPEDRNIGYLFQNYALFPHMNVAENVGYGSLVRGEAKAHTKKVTEEMLRFVNLLEWAGFMPRELSGGMQQRAALVRALATGCRTLFLDEPMSSLDPKIGVKLRYEIQKAAKKMGLTVVHVTHDQSDAMSISDRIIVMKAGKVVQAGTPKEIYNHPSRPYVAHFIGESNFMKAGPSGSNVLSIDGHTVIVKENVSGMKGVVAAIRPEKILFEKRLENTFEGVVESVDFLGPVARFNVRLNDVCLSVSTAKRPDIKKGMKVNLYLPPENLMVFCDIANLEEELKVM